MGKEITRFAHLKAQGALARRTNDDHVRGLGRNLLAIALTIVAGGLIGFNREEHGRAAGLCTMILVCLAASASMILVNLMMATAGRHGDSFIMLDLMRLPLGILSGMGFIGAGAILRRGERGAGCDDGRHAVVCDDDGAVLRHGQIGLGLAMLAAGIGVLWLLKWVEKRMAQDRRSVLLLSSNPQGPGEEAIREQLAAAGFRIVLALTYAAGREIASHIVMNCCGGAADRFARSGRVGATCRTTGRAQVAMEAWPGADSDARR